jgi:hypothetical protein
MMLLLLNSSTRSSALSVKWDSNPILLLSDLLTTYGSHAYHHLIPVPVISSRSAIATTFCSSTVRYGIRLKFSNQLRSKLELHWFQCGSESNFSLNADQNPDPDPGSQPYPDPSQTQIHKKLNFLHEKKVVGQNISMKMQKPF